MRNTHFASKSFQAILCFIVLLLSLPALSEISSETSEIRLFQKNNPDGQKYEFIKEYINSLSYLRSNLERDDDIFQSKEVFDRKLAEARIASLVQNNANMRIARNLLEKYRASPNGLILKTSDLFGGTCNRLIALNNEERQLLQSMVGEKEEEKISKEAYKKYAESWSNLSSQRKTLTMSIVESSLLASKVLISSKATPDGKLNRLGVTREEKDKLVKKLDEYFKGIAEKGMKEGQSYLEASVSNLRGALEDPSRKQYLEK